MRSSPGFFCIFCVLRIRFTHEVASVYNFAKSYCRDALFEQRRYISQSEALDKDRLEKPVGGAVTLFKIDSFIS